ncbi:hypothetical protein BG011_001646 [Mortierella polycephala]|uniref:PROP1-like PPR domain-containing protein n=1 Tax=Mortierella polycephala TaxID=41804 RepID=A0A9P6U5Z2_9FUNG|nr:hypothetical protein BG011_001646 [Mortierella polycephala]
MMNLKTTALLGNITRQGVSRQFIPLSSNSKTSVLNLSQRTAAQGGNVSAANAPANPVRSFSSTQANRENNNNTANGHHITGAHQFSSYPIGHFSHHSSSYHSLSSSTQLFQSPLTANLNSFRKDLNKGSSGSKATPKYTQLSKNAWDAINGQDARAVFSYLQEMRHEGFYADSALSSRIISQFLDMNSPQDAEKALSILVDCHNSQGRTLSPQQIQTYTSLAKDIANHSSDFAQALSLAKLLDRHGLLASSGFADGTLRSYRQLKSTSGLDAVKGIINVNDIETLLTLQSSLARTNNRYKHLIEILLDAKEMNLVPSQESCSRISLSFMKLNDYTGQLAWDTAVQEIYPGYRATVPAEMEQETASIGSIAPQQQQNTAQSYTSSNNRSYRIPNSSAQASLRSSDPSEAIIRACRFGYAAVALEGINKMMSQNQMPSPQAIADTIQVCAKREKERATDYRQLFELAEQSLDGITDQILRRAAEYEVYNAMLVANATLGDMTKAKKNYDDIVNLGQFPDATGYATLLIATTTGAVDEAHDALKILEEVKRHRIKPNIFFYNVVIGKLSRGRKIERVLEVYEEMIQHNIRPNAITYGTLISACTRVGSEDMARNLFQEMVRSPNYSPRHGPHNAMIQFYVRQKKDRQLALHYYEDMLKRRLTPTEHTYTLLVEAFACIQPYDLTEANHLIESLKRGPVRASEAHYGALIHAYGVQHGDVSTAETVFQNMRASGIIPKGPAYQSLIESFIASNQVSRAVSVRDDLLKSGQSSSAYIENTLIRGYGLEKQIRAAEEIFEAMLDPCSAPSKKNNSNGHGHGHGNNSNKNNGAIVKEPSTYQSMVTAYLENGMLDKANDTLIRMKGQHYPELVIKPVEEAIQAAAAAAGL